MRLAIRPASMSCSQNHLVKYFKKIYFENFFEEKTLFTGKSVPSEIKNKVKEVGEYIFSMVIDIKIVADMHHLYWFQLRPSCLIFNSSKVTKGTEQCKKEVKQ